MQTTTTTNERRVIFFAHYQADDLVPSASIIREIGERRRQ